MDSEKLIAELVNQIQMGTRQTRDGSHLENEAINEHLNTKFSEALSKIVNEASNVMSKSKIKKEVDEFKHNLRELGIKGKERKKLAQEYEKELKNERKTHIENIRNFRKNEEEARKKYVEMLNKEASSNVSRNLSNGQSDKVTRLGQSTQEFGRSLYRVSNGKGGLAKLGVAAKSAGTILTKFSEWIGVAINALSAAYDVAKKVYKHGTKDIEIDIQEIGVKGDYELAQIRREMALINGAGKIQSRNNSTEQSISQANINYLQTAQSAAIAMTNEIGGVYAELAKEGKKIGFDAYSTAHEIVSAAPFDIKGTMYKAADAAIESAFKIENFDISKKYGEKTKDIAKSKYSAEIDAAKAVKDATIDMAQFERDKLNALDVKQFGYEYAYSGQENRRAMREGMFDVDIARQRNDLELANAINDGVGQVTSGVVPVIGDVIHGAVKEGIEWRGMALDRSSAEYHRDSKQEYYDIAAAKARAESSMALQRIITDTEISEKRINTDITIANANMAKTQQIAALELRKLQYDTVKSIENFQLEAAKAAAKAWMKMTQNVNDAWLKAETASFKMGREMGLTGDSLRSYSKELSMTQLIVSKWGKNLEWIQKTQSAYQETTGRNVELTTQDLETSAAFGHIVGDDTITEYTSGMEIFNHSVEDSNEKLYTMFKEVSKIGLNGKKYAKDLAKNLKLAEKYNFKGGVEGLMKMSKWAQNMRFNVDSFDGMLDKVQEGGLEGVIKQAAELQVLGGNFAMGSDPMAMAYESYMDPEAYAKRMNSMIAGQGFLKENGEVGFGIASQQMMRQYAKSSGQDYKDVLNQARAQVKLGAIESNLNGNFTDDQKSLIANKAKFNQETQQWEVNSGRKDAFGNSVMTAVGDLTAADIQNMEMEDPEDVNKAMLDQLKSIFSSEEEMKNMQQQAFAYLQNGQWGKLRETNQSIINQVRDEFFEKYDNYADQLRINLDGMKSAMTEFYKLFNEGDGPIDQKIKAIQDGVKSLDVNLKRVGGEGDSYLSQLKKMQIPPMEMLSKVDLQNRMGEIIAAIKNEAAKVDETSGSPEIKKWEKWMNKGDWKDDHFASAAAIMANSSKGSEAYQEAWDDIRGVGLTDIAEDGYETWMAEDDVIAAYNYLLKKGKIKKDGSVIKDGNGIGGDTYSATSNYARGIYHDGIISHQGIPSKIGDGKIDNNGHPIRKINDGPIDENGLVVQNGIPTLIDKNDQVLAAKNGGPLDRLMDMAIEPMRAAQRAEEEYKRAMGGMKEERENVRQRLIIDVVQASTQLGNTNPSNNAKLLNQLVSGGGFLKENGEVGFGISTQMMMHQFADVTGQDYKDVLNEAREMVREAYYDPEKLMKRLGTSSSNDWESILTKTNSKSSRTDVTTVQQHQSSSSNWADVSPHPMSYEGNGINTTHNSSNWADVSPRPMPYDSYVKENPYSGSSNNNNSNSGRIEIPPIQININGSIQLSGGSGNVDITQQIANDPNFIRSLSQLISMEVEKKVRGGRVVNPLNRGLEY